MVALPGAVSAQATQVCFDRVCSAYGGATTAARATGLNLTLGFKRSVIDDPGDTFTAMDSSSEQLNHQVVFDATGMEILRLNDLPPDPLFWVGFQPAPGAARFSEGTGQSLNPLTHKDDTYTINRIQDNSPFATVPAPLTIDGVFVRGAAQAVAVPRGLRSR